MKKLSIIALALAASLMLSACDGGTYERDDDDNNRSGTHEKVDKPNKDKVPDIEPISPSKLEYEFVADGDCGPGIQINAVNTAAEEICFPDNIDGEPVVYISKKLVYSENVKKLIFPDSVAFCGYFPESVEFVQLPQNLEAYTISERETSYGKFSGYSNKSIFKDCENLKEVLLPDTLEYLPTSSSAFYGCPSDVIITYKGKKYTKDNFPYAE